MAAVAPPEVPRTKLDDKSFFHITLVIVVGIFATTLPQPQVLGLYPLRYVLKDHLHCSADQVSLFFLLCGMAWYLKPFAGILTDAFPLFGTKRRHYMLWSSVLAAISWIGLLLIYLFIPSYVALLVGALIVNIFMVMGSTATGAFLVEAGQSYGATGKLTSVRSFVANVCNIMNGYAGGWLASIAFFWVAGINAVMVISLFPIAYLYLRERRVQVSTSQSLEAAGGQLKSVFSSGSLWLGLGFIFLFYFAPGFATLQFFRQSNELKFSSVYIGTLASINGAFGLVGAVIYTNFIKRMNIRTLMFWGILLNGLGTFLYLPMFYTNPLTAAIVEGQNGLTFAIAEISLLDLAARCTPVGAEGLGYSLILSFRNLAVFGADYVGSKLNKLHPLTFTFKTMVCLNASTTLFVLIFLPFLPAALMRTRDKAVTSEPDPELRKPEDDL